MIQPLPSPARALASTLIAATLALGLAPRAALAQSQPPMPELFRGADLAVGEKLIQANACAACHQRKVGGDGSAIYRPQGRINSPTALLGMVDRCNNELSMGLFPEEVMAMAAVLQRDHYRFAATLPK